MPDNSSAVPSYPNYGYDSPLRLFTQGNNEQQVRDYINQTLGDYSGLQPLAGTQADQSGQGRNTQLSAMGQLGGLIGNGWDAGSREAQRQATNRSNDATQGNFGSQLQETQMSGGRAGAGSSAALAAQAAQSQGSANAQNVGQRSAQAAALSRRLQALGAYGSLAGAIRGGDINANEQGFQNQLQQIGGQSAARNSLANYYTNQINQGAAQNAANWQAALGAGGLALGGMGALSGMGGGSPYQVGYSTDYGAGSLLPNPQAPINYGNFPNYFNTP